MPVFFPLPLRVALVLCKAFKMEEGVNKILALSITIGRQSLSILLMSNAVSNLDENVNALVPVHLVQFLSCSKQLQVDLLV